MRRASGVNPRLRGPCAFGAEEKARDIFAEPSLFLAPRPGLEPGTEPMDTSVVMG